MRGDRVRHPRLYFPQHVAIRAIRPPRNFGGKALALGVGHEGQCQVVNEGQTAVLIRDETRERMENGKTIRAKDSLPVSLTGAVARGDVVLMSHHENIVYNYGLHYNAGGTSQDADLKRGG